MKTGDFRKSDLLRGAAIPQELLIALPKTELHCHLDGSLRMETFMELGRAAGLEMPEDPDRVRARFFPEERECLVHEFLSHFDHTVAVLQTAENLSRVARELVQDFAAEGVWYLEVRFCPLKHTEAGLTADQAVEAVQRGLQEAEAETGITTGIILTGIRTIEPEHSLVLARLAAQMLVYAL